LRTLDAIHLASAQIADPAEMIVYDRRLQTAAEDTGFVVVSPGAS
jgi:predicted nucleic acid-binding protein